MNVLDEILLYITFFSLQGFSLLELFQKKYEMTAKYLYKNNSNQKNLYNI